MLPFNSFDFPDRLWNFQVTYKCYSISMMPGNVRLDIERGGKILMPPSALETLTHLHVSYPMLFKLKNEEKEYTSHAGVLEFIADEGKCYLPRWMMNNLRLEEEDNISIESVSLPVATFSKFQPLTSEFLDITNPKAVLENALRNFACLTTGDVIAIQYNEKIYELCVLQTRPGNAVTIIECDMNVEFEAPADYQSPSQMNLQNETVDDGDDHANERNVLAFEGSGLRLDGKKKKPEQLTAPVVKKFKSRGIPDYEYSFGVIKFNRTVKAISDRVKKTENLVEHSDSDGFHGRGSSMK